MAAPRPPNSLAEVARVTRDAETFSFALRHFLDVFYTQPRSDLFSESPPLLSAVLDDRGLADAYLAAVAAHLATRFGFETPEWALSPARELKKPWFAMKSHGGRMFLLVESPAAFRERNIFVSADALVRV